MLVALIYLYNVSDTFSIIEWYRVPLALNVQLLLFIAFFLSFSVKVPMWPVHGRCTHGSPTLTSRRRPAAR